MKFSTALFLGAGLAAGAVYAGKKWAKRLAEDDPDSVIYAESTNKFGEKVHKASLFAVGAVRTGADKIAEGFHEVREQDMVRRGEDTITFAKEKAEILKKEIEDLKNLVISINFSVDPGAETETAEESEEDASDKTPEESAAAAPEEITKPSTINDIFAAEPDTLSAHAFEAEDDTLDFKNN